MSQTKATMPLDLVLFFIADIIYRLQMKTEDKDQFLVILVFSIC